MCVHKSRKLNFTPKGGEASTGRHWVIFLLGPTFGDGRRAQFVTIGYMEHTVPLVANWKDTTRMRKALSPRNLAITMLVLTARRREGEMVTPFGPVLIDLGGPGPCE